MQAIQRLIDTNLSHMSNINVNMSFFLCLTAGLCMEVCVSACVSLGRLLESWVNAGTKQCSDCPRVLYMHLRMGMNTVLQIDHTHTTYICSVLLFDIITQQQSTSYHKKAEVMSSLVV